MFRCFPRLPGVPRRRASGLDSRLCRDRRITERAEADTLVFVDAVLTPHADAGREAHDARDGRVVGFCRETLPSLVGTVSALLAKAPMSVEVADVVRLVVRPVRCGVYQFRR